jgi:serine/threonine protein kinase
MSQAATGPEWMKNGRCEPRYIWHIDNGLLQTAGFRQADQITLARRQVRKKDSRVEPELYVCKWYSTVRSGLKYVQREATAFASINHPNIVRFQDFSYELGKAQLARLYMEYCPRGDLSQFSRRTSRHTGSRLSYNEGGQVLNQLAQALLYLHHGVFKSDEVLKLAKLDFDVFKVEDESQPVNDVLKDFKSTQDHREWKTILHRDIKPANGIRQYVNGVLTAF